LPVVVTAAGERASIRFLEFFAANIRNPPTRRAYYRAAEEFLTCAKEPLFRTIGRGTGSLTRIRAAAGERLRDDPPTCSRGRHRSQARQSQLPSNGDHRYLKNGGTLEKAAAMANHASTRTTQLYDHRRDEVSLDEVERIMI